MVMDMTYAIISNGTVVNMILWDGEAEWAPPTGTQAILVPENESVSIGYTYSGTTFSAPAE
jgi:hypothetical protein